MQPLKVETQLEIPLAAERVFAAATDPKEVRNYFFSEASGPLESGCNVIWTFEDAGVSGEVYCISRDDNSEIKFTWGEKNEQTVVTMTFNPTGENDTTVHITEEFFEPNEAGIKRLREQTQGWMHFLLCLKAYLLFNVDLRRGVKL